MSQIMSINDELMNKRKHSLTQERAIDTLPASLPRGTGNGAVISLIEKLIGLAAMPLIAFAGFIFLCLCTGVGLFLALCRSLAVLWPARNHAKEKR